MAGHLMLVLAGLMATASPEPLPSPEAAAYPEPLPDPEAYPGPLPDPEAYPDPLPDPAAYPGPLPDPAAYPGPLPDPGAYPEPLPDPAAQRGSDPKRRGGPGSDSDPHGLHYVNFVYTRRIFCDASQPPACALNTSLTYCLEDEDYPLFEVQAFVQADATFGLKYAEVPGQSADNLVDGITREHEETMDYSFYTGSSTGSSPFDLTHWTGPSGFVCPSEVSYATPKRARNVGGFWRVIVNDLQEVMQTIRIESCLFPRAACRTIGPSYQSHCLQKHNYQRLLSWDPCDPYKGLFLDTYRFPTACSCFLR
ncbi:uncharacterized protein LOC143026927 [Oratosquilla oratoria]|uniref:uncharacterized protein LOC143026927 n=1 Tax=Oratosquilla oratoria TaxID=337810 RepID=UPI003F7662C3